MKDAHVGCETFGFLELGITCVVHSNLLWNGCGSVSSSFSDPYSGGFESGGYVKYKKTFFRESLL